MLLILLTTAILLPLGNLWAQSSPNTQQGDKPNDVTEGGDIDSVSLTSGSLLINVPIASFPQRGDLSLSFSFRHASKQWRVATSTRTGKRVPAFWTTDRQDQSVPQEVVSSLDYTLKWQGGLDASSTTVLAPDGASHTLYIGSTLQYPLRSIDASGLLLPDRDTLIESNGIRHTGWAVLASNRGKQATQTTDRNGNVITLSTNGWVDTMNRSIPGSAGGSGMIQAGVATTDLSNCPAGTASARQWDIPDLGTSVRTFKFCYSNVTLSSSFQQPNVIEYPPTSNSLLTAIVRPDLTSWTFSYDNYGDVTKVVYPTGGSLSYTYVIRGAGSCSDQTPVSRWVATRTLDANDGAGGHQWTYNYDGADGTVKVTDPLMNEVIHTIAAPISGAPCSLYDVQADVYQGSAASGKLLQTTATQYQGVASPYNGLDGSSAFVAANVVQTQVTTTWPAGKSSRMVFTYDKGVATPSTSQPIVLGALLQKDKYDYSGALARSTIYHYKWQDDPNFLNANQLGATASTVVQDAAGHQLAKTTYGYDESTLADSGFTSTNHAPAPGPVRGNVTSTGRWLDTTDSMVTSTATYFDTGMPATSTDPLGNTASMTYSPTYLGTYLTQSRSPDTTMPETGSPTVIHAVSVLYDYNTGLPTQTTDENGNKSTLSYDNMHRPLIANSADGGQTTRCYGTWNSSGQCVSDPTTVEIRRTVDLTAGTFNDLIVRADGLDRVIHSEETTAGGTVHVDTTYDAVGHVSTTSNPYYKTSDSTYGLTSSAYDALGRVIKITYPDLSISAVSYTDNCTVATDEASNQKKGCMDALGQLVEVDEPSPGSLASPAVANLTISGSVATAATPAIGSFTVSGAEQSATAATTGTGSITVGGSEVSRTVLTHAATAGAGSVTIGGSEGSLQSCVDGVNGAPPTCQTVYDSGSVAVTVQGLTKNALYGSTTSTGGLASTIASAFNSDSTSKVSASVSGSTINFIAKTTGASTNYSLSSSSTTNDPTDFGSASFTTSTSGAALTGGTDNVNTLVFDAGSVNVTVNGSTKTVAYGQPSNGAAIASALAAAFNADSNSPVTASTSGSVLSLTTKATGATTGYPLSASSATTSQYFSAASFTMTASGANLAAGQNAGTFDTGSVTVTINGTAFVSSYTGPVSTAATLAADLAGKINAPSGRVVDASASGGTISLQAHTAGAAGNTISIAASSQHTTTSTFPNPSFTSSASGGTLAGGSDAASDSGTLTATIGTFTAASVSYGTGSNATPAQVAAALAKVLGATGSPLIVDRVTGPTIPLAYKTDGTAGNGVAVTVKAVSSQPASFPNGTYATQTTLNGGAAAVAPSLDTPYKTFYTYDLLGRLRCSEQHGDAATGTGCSSDPSNDATSPWRIRRFNYDSLSRLLSQSSPEAGSICYGVLTASGQCSSRYDLDGRLLAKTDARGIVTTYRYDTQSRLLDKTYSDGTPKASFRYDSHPTITVENGIGRLVSTSNSAASFVSSFNAVGWVKKHFECLASNCQAFTMTYDGLGDPLTVSYPNGFTMSYTYDTAGWVQSAKDGTGFAYADTLLYYPSGALNVLSRPHLYLEYGLNNRRQLTYGYAGNNAGTSLFYKQYNYDTNGHNNGALLSTTNVNDSTRSQVFGYDGLNRLVRAGEGGIWGNTYKFDAWGNLLAKVRQPGTTYSEETTIGVDVHNRVTGYQYDLSGNVTSDGVHTYKYDAENRLIAFDNTTYTYDADGKRIAKAGGATSYWYNAGGQLLGTTDAAGQWTTLVFLGEMRLASNAPGTSIRFFVDDQLGSTNVLVGQNGTVIDDLDYYPWGGQVPTSKKTSNNEFLFTGKERDAESGLDFFGARYYSSLMGRFLQADPVAFTGGRLLAPQSVNRYSYADGNPIAHVDPNGRDTLDAKTVERIQNWDTFAATVPPPSLPWWYVGPISPFFASQQPPAHSDAEMATKKLTEDEIDAHFHSFDVSDDDLRTDLATATELVDSYNKKYHFEEADLIARLLGEAAKDKKIDTGALNELYKYAAKHLDLGFALALYYLEQTLKHTDPNAHKFVEPHWQYQLKNFLSKDVWGAKLAELHQRYINWIFVKQKKANPEPNPKKRTEPPCLKDRDGGTHPCERT
jgi:RHS repeat-associated protein